MHITDAPVFAGEAHAGPVAVRSETFGGPSHGSVTDSHDGGGLLEGSGTIHGEAPLEVLALPSLATEKNNIKFIMT